MKKIKFILGTLLIIIGSFAVYFVLSHESALIVHPKGVVAKGQLDVIIRNILLMLIVVVPTFIFLFLIAWGYSAKKTEPHSDQKHSYKLFGQLILWIIPLVVIAPMTYLTWYDTHKLDPFKPIDSVEKPLTVQVVAIDWKWLFIYPELGIATVNFVQFPARTPIRFLLSADGSPMNSFWIPQLSGQIYCMTGMTTQLNVMADEPHEYAGRAAEINGKGFAHMTFIAKSTTQSDFERWVERVKRSPLKLTDSNYTELLKPSENNPIALYSYVEKDLFKKIVMKYMHPKVTD